MAVAVELMIETRFDGRVRLAKQHKAVCSISRESRRKLETPRKAFMGSIFSPVAKMLMPLRDLFVTRGKTPW
jgi:hypothetical protein